MKKLLFILVLPILAITSCSPLSNNEGWNPSGYVIRHQDTEIKIGFIGTDLIYYNAQSTSGEDKIRIEEDLKDQGIIIGFTLTSEW